MRLPGAVHGGVWPRARCADCETLLIKRIWARRANLSSRLSTRGPAPPPRRRPPPTDPAAAATMATPRAETPTGTWKWMWTGRTVADPASAPPIRDGRRALGREHAGVECVSEAPRPSARVPQLSGAPGHADRHRLRSRTCRHCENPRTPGHTFEPCSTARLRIECMRRSVRVLTSLACARSQWSTSSADRLRSRRRPSGLPREVRPLLSPACLGPLSPLQHRESVRPHPRRWPGTGPP